MDNIFGRMAQAQNKASDNELAEAAKTNPDVFGELVKRYQERLFRYVRRISYFSNEDIEDIVQEVFIKAYRSLNIFDGEYKFSTWIYQIARNATIDAIRKKQVRPKTVSIDEDDAVKLFRSEINIQTQLETKERIEIIRKIISSLPYKYREVMVLRFLEDKDYAEIVEIVQKPRGTVAALISRGKTLFSTEAQKNGLL